MRVKVDKYEVVQEADGRLHALRNGEAWRDCVGDKLVLALAAEVERLRELLNGKEPHDPEKLQQTGLTHPSNMPRSEWGKLPRREEP